MAVSPLGSNARTSFRNTVVETIEDAVSGELMTKAVTLFPCGHVFNEDTAIQCLARSKLCPLDRKPIEKYVPNYAIREIAESAKSQPADDEKPSKEAEVCFQRGKGLHEKGDHGAAVTEFLKALQISPNYEKAQAYLDFCLSQSPSASASPPTIPKPSSLPGKEKVGQELKLNNSNSSSSLKASTLLPFVLDLLENKEIKGNAPLFSVFEMKVHQLMELPEEQELNTEDQTFYKWSKQLFDQEKKLRNFVANKLIGNPTLSPPSKTSGSPVVNSNNLSVSSRVLPTAASLFNDANTEIIAIPTMAFGKAKWEKYYGDVGVEPPLPSNIQEILNGPCPIWPGKKVQKTHVLVLIPKTVNGKPLTLSSLGELVKTPKGGGHAMWYKYFWGEAMKQYGDQPVEGSYWILMTKDILPDSRDESVDQHQARLQKYPSYEMPRAIEASIALFSEYVVSQTRLYADNPWTFTRCQERIDKWSLAVGGFAVDGPTFFGIWCNDCGPDFGVGGCRKL